MITEDDKKQTIKKVKFDFEKLSSFIENNSVFENKEATKGIFSLGVLVHLVYSMQLANLNNTPFEKKLKGLHLTPKDVKRIFNEAIEKVNQYAYQTTYKELREYISESLLTNYDYLKKMTDDEITFNFVCGIELGKKFKS
ncbi:TM1802 family CRISPR-associated protein [Psychroflexus planctonicus]|uniref:CRISPR type III-B/RAMP module-associated protein Cmr5 n=1 Tax=Psychroflexus planctonicus TaxID=1526575 RepID=A0ABQ1SC82_9FLAO|nr:TM1802 family CRISPR-associated protein [Psychroflexus planctonicus]GGE27215.1 hypothetical protein GCM10010832_04970 [Psychroflexus planctonicus]